MKTINTRYGAKTVSEEAYELLSWIATIETEERIKKQELRSMENDKRWPDFGFQQLYESIRIRVNDIQKSLWGLETAAICMKIDDALIWHTKEKPEDFRNMNRIAIIENLSPIK